MFKLGRDIERRVPSVLGARCDLGYKPNNSPLAAAESLQPPSEFTKEPGLPTADIATGDATGSGSDNDTANDEGGAGPGLVD